MSNITMTKATAFIPSGFGMPVYGCALGMVQDSALISIRGTKVQGMQAIAGATAAVVRERHLDGAVVSATRGAFPGLPAWSPPIC